MPADYQKSVLKIYDDTYAEDYAARWNDTTPFKNPGNLACIEELIVPGGKWMDLCCGTAWHFSQVSTPCEKTGLDISGAQLSKAKISAPAAKYIEGDVLEVTPRPEFDLVTSFWIGYGYLDDFNLISEFCHRMVSWLKPGGNLILEIIDRKAVSEWNSSNRARETIERVFRRSSDWYRWTYFDKGGAHNLTTPDLQFFEEIFSPYFAKHEFRFERNWCGISRL